MVNPAKVFITSDQLTWERASHWMRLSYGYVYLVGGFNTPLKNIWARQWEGWHPIYEMENKSHFWNRQPGILYIYNGYGSNLSAPYKKICYVYDTSSSSSSSSSSAAAVQPLINTWHTVDRSLKPVYYTKCRSRTCINSSTGSTCWPPIFQPRDVEITKHTKYLRTVAQGIWTHLTLQNP